VAEQRRLAAILAVDVAGYSRLMGEDEAGTARAVREHRDAARPIVAGHGGRIVKTMGDGLLLEFPSVVAAVECAIAVQKLMAERNADIPEGKRIVYRIGVNLGDVLIEGDDILGDGVNIAARLEGIAEPGGIRVSGSAYEHVRGKIDAEFTDLGDRELKNIARPVRVYAIDIRSLDSSPVTPAKAGVRPSASESVTAMDTGLRRYGDLKATANGGGGPPRLSIVVLPFANIGGDPEQDYFVDGVTESLTTDLSRISGSFVIARNTAFTFKGKPVDVKWIARELDVRYVLEGSVQRGGNRMRVNIQLIDAETGNHLWAERFDKPVADLFDMQDEIVARLANQLNAQLIAAEARRAEKSTHPDSIDLVFQGAACWHQSAGNPQHMNEARSYFEKALALDSRNVEALVGRSWIDTFIAAAAMSDDRGARLATAETTIFEALSLAPNHAFAHFVLAWIYAVTNRASLAVAEGERAATLDRNLASAHYVIGFAKITLGLAQETEAHVLEALRLSPHDALAHAWMTVAGYAKLWLGENETAVTWFRRSIEANRTVPLTHFLLAAALANLDRHDEARVAANAGLVLDPRFTVTRFRRAVTTQTQERERIYEGMRQAGVLEG
jgi:TolB-like protein/class 3 adenylate cyclase/Flp pilus assembly protein TadD